MKIIFDYKIFWNQKFGGISRYFVNLIKKLDNKKDIDYKVISPFYKNSYLNEVNTEKVFGKYTPKPFPKTSFFLKNSNELFFKYFISFFKPDIIHNTYYNHNFKTNKPLILTVYDLIHEKISRDQNKHLLPKKKAIERANHIICISEETRSDLINFYNYPIDQTSVIYLGSDHLSNIASNQLNLQLKKKYILFIGSREKYKNFNFLINTLNEMKNNNLMLVCFGGKKFTENEINKNSINTEIKQVFGDDTLLKELLKNALCVINPSKYEGFSLPNLEAMATGCPLICSDIDVFNEICRSSAMYFDLNDRVTLIDCINKLLNDEDYKNQLVKKGLARANMFMWDDCSNETINIYNKFK
jgi:glycosyltransferase involved in cell wall biosynthesis